MWWLRIHSCVASSQLPRRPQAQAWRRLSRSSMPRPLSGNVLSRIFRPAGRPIPRLCQCTRLRVWSRPGTGDKRPRSGALHPNGNPSLPAGYLRQVTPQQSLLPFHEPMVLRGANLVAVNSAKLSLISHVGLELPVSGKACQRLRDRIPQLALANPLQIKDLRQIM